jgi:hypothetical protein
MLENDVPTEAAANKPSPKPNVKQPAKARSFFQQSPAKPSRKTSSPIIKSSHSGAQAAAGQQRKISLQPNDDPGKVGGGRVKQARLKIMAYLTFKVYFVGF